MEVHATHEPIHTAKDFFLHLFTITIGLLIAVGIEGMVEWRHHMHLVNEASETLRLEVEHKPATTAESNAGFDHRAHRNRGRSAGSQENPKSARRQERAKHQVHG